MPDKNISRHRRIVLAPVVGVEDEGRWIVKESIPQSLNHQDGMVRRQDRKSDNSSREHIHDGGNVDNLPLPDKVGEVSHPDMVRIHGHRREEEIRIDA